MQLHEIQRNTPLKQKRRIGRGGHTGKTSGRGTKGQNARAGGAPRPEIRDQIKKVPKKRGYRFSSIVVKPAVVNLALISKLFSDADIVSPEKLLSLGAIKRIGGKAPKVKILGTGNLTVKNLTFKGCEVSVAAAEAIKTAGGKLESA